MNTKVFHSKVTLNYFHWRKFLNMLSITIIPFRPESRSNVTDDNCSLFSVFAVLSKRKKKKMKERREEKTKTVVTVVYSCMWLLFRIIEKLLFLLSFRSPFDYTLTSNDTDWISDETHNEYDHFKLGTLTLMKLRVSHKCFILESWLFSP